MQRKLKTMQLLFVVCIAASVVSIAFPLPTPAQSQTASAPKTEAAPQSFEVASIKPSEAQAGLMSVRNSPGGMYSASGITAKALIQQAYDVQDYQISGGPSWLASDRYNINAKAETPNINREQMRNLLRSLLAERFNLKLNRETKELPIYVLLVGKKGHKLRASEVQPAAGDPGTAARSAGGAGSGGGNVQGVISGAAVGGGGGLVVAGSGVVIGAGGTNTGSSVRMGPQMSVKGAPISTLVSMLSRTLGRPVMDQTDLKGNFDFTLEYVPEGAQNSGETSGPSIFTALQEQLGLRLESQKGPVDVLVIERIDKPSKN